MTIQIVIEEGRTEGRNVLFNDTFNTFYLWIYGIRHMVKDNSNSEKGRKEGRNVYLTTHFIYGYMVSGIW